MNAEPRAGQGLADLDALQLRERFAAGAVNPVEVGEAYVARIADREPRIRAFAYFDAEHVRQAAKAANDRRLAGRALGPLNGIPVGVKDIVDTSDMPTENGSALDAGRRPTFDATIVSRLRAAGAIIAGKTTTTEFAYAAPPTVTENPLDGSRTPGGSSAGSAAAVAARMLPLAIGTQTNGSVIRPASFCGIVGYKPTFGWIPRMGVLPGAPPLDTVGVFGRSVADVALLADALVGFDGFDSDVKPSAPPRLLDAARAPVPVPPDFAFVRTPAWDKADPETRLGFEELVSALGKRCMPIGLSDRFDGAFAMHRKVMLAGMARSLGKYVDRAEDQIGAPVREAIAEGRQVRAVDYLEALDAREALNNGLDEAFARFDALITPAVPGEAPPRDTTGDASFCTIWSFCGVPAITLPLLEGPNGMPVGVQLVGRRGNDARLLRTAQWLVDFVTNVA